jgi:hypothetical protein
LEWAKSERVYAGQLRRIMLSGYLPQSKLSLPCPWTSD